MLLDHISLAHPNIDDNQRRSFRESMRLRVSVFGSPPFPRSTASQSPLSTPSIAPTLNLKFKTKNKSTSNLRVTINDITPFRDSRSVHSFRASKFRKYSKSPIKFKKSPQCGRQSKMDTEWGGFYSKMSLSVEKVADTTQSLNCNSDDFENEIFERPGLYKYVCSNCNVNY